MMDDSQRRTISDLQPLAIIAIPVAAVMGFTAQPLIAIANPIAISLTGSLIATLIVVILAGMLNDKPSALENAIGGIVFFSTIAGLTITVGNAWWEQKAADAICARLQHVMLYEHRIRKDVPEIFRSLGCHIQT